MPPQVTFNINGQISKDKTITLNTIPLESLHVKDVSELYTSVEMSEHYYDKYYNVHAIKPNEPTEEDPGSHDKPCEEPKNVVSI